MKNNIVLFPHNQKIYNKTKKHLVTNKKACIVMPTGTGKTVIATKLLKDFSEKGCRQVVIGPNDSIIRAFREVDPNIDDYVVFYSYMTLSKSKNSYKQIKKTNPKLIVIDEYHRSGARTWGVAIDRLFRENGPEKILGLTATDIRYLDNNKNMTDKLFGESNLIIRETIFTAVEKKILPKPKYIAGLYDIENATRSYLASHGVTDLRSNPSKRIYSDMAKLKKLWETAETPSNIIQKNCSKKDNKFLCFFESIEMLEQYSPTVQEWLEKAFPQSKISRTTITFNDRTKRKASIMQNFTAPNTANEIKLLCCIDILNESFHHPSVTSAILLRSTRSPNIAIQQLGRVLHPKAITQPKIFDFVNNLSLIKAYRSRKSSQSIRDTTDQTIEISDSTFENVSFDVPFEIIESQPGIMRILEGLDFRTSKFYIGYLNLREYIRKNEKLPSINSPENNFIRLCKNLFEEQKLTEKQIIMLEKLGITLDKTIPTTQIWENHLETMKNEVESNTIATTTKLWIARQRQYIRNNKLLPHRKTRFLEVYKAYKENINKPKEDINLEKLTEKNILEVVKSLPNIVRKLYPIYCCGKEPGLEKSRPNNYRCSTCHKNGSIYSNSPLHHLKLSKESFAKYLLFTKHNPKIVSPTIISKTLGMPYQGLFKLKTRNLTEIIKYI